MLWLFSTIGRACYGCCTIVASIFLISCDMGKEAGHSLAFFMASWPYLRLFTKQRTRREGTLRAPCSSFEDASPEHSLRKAANGRTTQAKRRLQHAEPQVRSSIAQMFQCVNCFFFEVI